MGMGTDGVKSKEQIEFDALLEKERSGAVAEDKVW